MAANNITLVNGSLVASIMEDIFKDLGQMAITSSSIPAGAFVCPEKEADMLLLLRTYESYLGKNNYLDCPGLLQLAVSLLAGHKIPAGDSVYLLPTFIRLNPLEQRLVTLMSQDKLLYLETDIIYGFDPGLINTLDISDTKTTHVSVTPLSDVERLPWLYSVDQSPPPVGDDALSCYHASLVMMILLFSGCLRRWIKRMT
ncbi:hypothetical protein JCM14036_25150 [Desulfotomaculum defluvii]